MSNPFRYGDGVDVPLDEMNVRKIAVDDPRRDHILAAIEAKTEELAAASKSTPLRLSPAALKSCGISLPQEGAA